MGGELAAGLVVLLQLLVVDGPDLGQFGPVVGVLNGGLAGRPSGPAADAAGCRRTGVGGGAGPATLLRPCGESQLMTAEGRRRPRRPTRHAFRHQHVVKPHELRIRRVVVLDVPEAEDGLLFDLTQDGEEGRFHPVAVESVFACLLGWPGTKTQWKSSLIFYTPE